MGSFPEIVRVFVAGVIVIGVATALFAPGRQTVSAIQASGTAAQGLLKTAESGQ